MAGLHAAPLGVSARSCLPRFSGENDTSIVYTYIQSFSSMTKELAETTRIAFQQ